MVIKFPAILANFHSNVILILLYLNLYTHFTQVLNLSSGALYLNGRGRYVL